MIEGVVPVSGLVTRNASDVPPVSITFGEDATFGTYIANIKASGLSFGFDPCSMLGVGLFNTSGNATISLVNQSWTPTVTTNDATGIITLVFTHASYAGISFTFTLTPTPDGYSIGLVTANTHSTIGVEWVAFPRLGCKPHSGEADNAYLSYGFCGGCVLKNPHKFTFNQFTVSPEAPSGMQFWDYFDAETKTHLYVATDDDYGYSKRWNLIGDGSSVAIQEWMHFFPNPRLAHNGSGVMPYTTTYNVRIALFRGLTADGRCGAYDSALRYRDWATLSARPWMSDGPWNDGGSSVSSRVKNSDFYYVAGQTTPVTNEWSRIVGDMALVQTIVGATQMMGLLYSWGANLGALIGSSFRPPAFEPVNQSSNLNSAIGTANAANIHLSFYTNPALWDSTLTNALNSPFGFDAFAGQTSYGAISQYVIRDKDDAPIGGYNFTPDPGPSDVPP